MLAGFLRQRYHPAKKELFVLGKDSVFCQVFVPGIGAAKWMHGHHYEICFPRMGQLQSLADMMQGVVVPHQAERIPRADCDRLVRDHLLELDPKLVDLDMGLGPPSPLIDAFGNREDQEEYQGEGDTANGGNLFGDQVDRRNGKKKGRYDTQSKRDFSVLQRKVDRYFPFARRLVFEAQDQYSQPLECERPDDSESVGFP